VYLIDGNNLIGHTKSISYKDPQARQLLLNRLQPFLETKRRKAVIVFDGDAEPLRKSHWMQLVFSGAKASADDFIRSQLTASRASRDLCVVSSDNAIYGYARSCGIQALRCHEFNRLLSMSAADNNSEQRDMRIDDLKEWLRYFGEEE
jgi:predicted RNA-binding protein with PIN domain